MLAYEVGILGMLAAPFLIFSVLGFLLWRAGKLRGSRPGSQSLPGPSDPR